MPDVLDRHVRIVGLVRARGYAGVAELARLLAVTPQTIRHDIATLAAEGQLRRHHGGAMLPAAAANEQAAPRHDLRRNKQRIARAVAAAVPEGAAVFLALGNTVNAVALELAQRGDLRVVTNSTTAALALNRAGGPEIFLLGGTVRRRNNGTVGAATVQAVAGFRCDLAIMSCGGLEADGTLLHYDEAEAAVMRAMAAQAGLLLLAVDHTKFLRPSEVRLGHLREVGVLVADAALPAPLARLARAAGTRVIVAS
jgi:DeoR family glycerol-3-phosphate regulon repressor